MDFLQKLDFLMEKYGLNKLTLSQNSGIPYFTIVGWDKKGYEGLKLTTLRKLSDYFNTVLDYWVSEDEVDPNYWKADGFIVNSDEMGHIQKYRIIAPEWQEAVDSILDIGYRQHQAEQPPHAAAAIKEQRNKLEAAEEAPIPVSEDGLEAEREKLIESLEKMSPGQMQMYFDQMRKLTKSRIEASPSFVLPEDDQKALEPDSPDPPQ